MSDDEPNSELTPDELRRRAEAKVASEPPAPPDDPMRVMHELRVHQAELEMQNDELRRLHHELERSRDHFRSRYYDLFDRAPIGYVTLDPDGRILEANAAAAQILGVERERPDGRRLSAFLDQAGGDAFHLHRRAVLSSDAKQSVDLSVHRPDGRVCPVHLDSVAMRDEAGTPTQIRTVLADLSELREAQEDARAQASRAQTLWQAAPDAIVTVDERSAIVDVNPAARRMFGYGRGELTDRHVRAILPALGERCPAAEMRAREMSGRRKDGTAFPVELGAGEWDDHGQWRLTAIVRDVSARAEAERRVRESEARFRQIAESIRDVFYVLEPDGAVSYVSPAFEEVWGRPAAALYEDASVWLEGVHPEDRDRVAEAWRRQLEGAPIDEAYRVVRPDGSVRRVRDRGYPATDAEGGGVRLIGVVRDVTAERELERELRQAQKMEAVGTLASGIAHDFGNLLQAVIGSVQMAMREGTPPERARRYLQGAEAAARRGARLTHQITSFGSKREARPKPVVVDAVVEGALELLRRLVGESIEVTAERGAPQGLVMADPTQLEHILMNLAANARDAMPSGGTIAIRTEEVSLDAAAAERLRLGGPGRFVRLEVRDTGVGMDERTQERMFEPFFTTKKGTKGTGLGLSTVFANTRKLGGHVGVRSAPGEGTTFVFHFPRHEEGRPVEAAPPTAARSFEGFRALLVEDEPLVRMTIRVYLEELGIGVSEHERPAEALERVAAEPELPLDLVVTDVVMPGVNGPELVERLRRERPELRVLYVSAHSARELVARGTVEAGARVLSKPFDREDLADQLARLLPASPEPRAAPRAATAEAPPAAPPPRAPAEPVARERPSVLVVDDSEVARAAIAEHLSALGYEVFATDGPGRALEWAAARREPIDLLLTELRLPDMTGDELAGRLRESNPELRVIYMAVDGEVPAGPEGALLQKPIALFSLSEEIGRALHAEEPAS
jgi:PAS domain S-box-containing protein